MATKYVTIDGTAVHYLHTGPTTLPDVPPALDRGRLFVLVHAAGSNAAMWRRQVEGLGARHSVVAMCLPGHGRSSGVDGCATIEEYADVVGKFVRALGLRKFVLVGRSMGGAAGLVLAAKHPELLQGLVVACSSVKFTLSPEGIETTRNVVRGRLPQQFTTETFSPSTGMDVMREAWMQQVMTDPRVRLGDLLACNAFDGRELLPRIHTPTLVIAGADDAVTPVEQSREIARRIAGARLEVLERAGHQAPLEQSEAFNALVEKFAAGLA